MHDTVLVWFRRDLRVHDHTALSEALRRARRVYCAFVFDTAILDTLTNHSDRRVSFIHASLVEVDEHLRQRAGKLIFLHGVAQDELPRLAVQLKVDAVFANRDYEPFAKARDIAVTRRLATAGIAFETFKDQVIFEGNEVLTLAGKPYGVFTPYRNAWLKRLAANGETELVEASCSRGTLAEYHPMAIVPTLSDLGFSDGNLSGIGEYPGTSGARRRIDVFRARLSDYEAQRDFPALDTCSHLSVHLRFGTVSIRELVTQAISAGALRGNAGAACWLNELIWREFYFMILDHHPRVATSAFKEEFDHINWEEGAEAEANYAAWCEGKTGYPLVDAAMRQLNTTGYMHNRLRMVVASFLCKDLGIDWRHGEAWFAQQLLDFDLAANNGGWQWAASSGCDAQPYFRIFNPVTQSKRFDPEGLFIRRYLPQLEKVPQRTIHEPWKMDRDEQTACGIVLGKDTPFPLVDHEQARRRTLARYARIKPGAAA